MTFDESYDDWLIEREFERRRKPKEAEWAKRLLRETPSDPSLSADPIDAYLGALLTNSRRAVKRVEADIYVRTKLHDEAIAQINYQITEAAGGLERFRGWGVGYNRGVDEKRLALERRLDTLRHEKRDLRVKFWDDLVRLRADCEERQKEYQALARRLRLR